MSRFQPETLEEMQARIQDALTYQQEHLHKEDIRALYKERDWEDTRREILLKVMNDPGPPDPDLEKHNQKATEIRLQGKRLYQNKQIGLALDKFYESICWATKDSAELGMGYANCSAVYYELAEYENALVCITLAKKHNYPHQLMPKLLKRETKCKEMIKSPRISPINSTFVSNVARNPTIPFLAEGIRMKQLPDYGRSMVAVREFKAGDLLLDEKVIIGSIKSGRKYSTCHYCFSALTVLKCPCPNCVSAIYCNDECREADMQVVHRFECGISKKLDLVSSGAPRIGLRVFFYGLTLFHDDVKKMMRFCNTHGRTGPDPFAVDYSNYDPLEEFKVFHQTKVPHLNPCLVDHIMVDAAQYYWILVKHRPIKDLFAPFFTTFRALVDHDAFLIQFMFVYMRAAHFLATYQVKAEITLIQLYSIAAVCNHSCIPNTCAVSVDGRLKFVALRPIKKNEQILTSYNIIYPSAAMEEIVSEPKRYFCSCEDSEGMGFKCMCLDCDPLKKRARLAANYETKLSIDPEHLNEVQNLGRLDLDSQLSVMQTFMQRYGHLHPHPGFDEYIRSYRDILIRAFLARSEHERRIQAGR